MSALLNAIGMFLVKVALAALAVIFVLVFAMDKLSIGFCLYCVVTTLLLVWNYKTMKADAERDDFDW